MSKPVLYYVYDPMCSWCWGYRPTWLKLQQALKDKLTIKYVLGGLAEDSDIAMPMEMQLYLQQTWQKISDQLGTQFNFDFWKICQPKRSTYPACRAIIVARQFDKEQAMCFAIQQAYYLQAKNPSNINVLTTIAGSIGIDEKCFAKEINSKATKIQLTNEIMQARALPIQGFPSLVLEMDGRVIPIKLDYKNWQTSFDIIIVEL